MSFTFYRETSMPHHHRTKLVVKPLLTALVKNDFQLEGLDVHDLLPNRTSGMLGQIKLTDIIAFLIFVTKQVIKLVKKHQQAHASIRESVEDLVLDTKPTLPDPPVADVQPDSTTPADAKDVVPTKVEDTKAKPTPAAPSALEAMFAVKPDLKA